jgi:hypothetical protein
MSRSIELLDACRRGDEVMVEQLGWRDVMDALRYWRKRLDGEALAPYASLLGDEDPDEIAAVLRGLAGDFEYRPGPADIYVRLLAARTSTPTGALRTPRLRPDITPAAFTAVLAAAAAGATVCECFPRPANVIADSHNVHRCPDCGGLECGQYESALDWSREQP